MASAKLELHCRLKTEQKPLHEVVESKSIYKVVNEVERIVRQGKTKIGVTSFEHASLQKKFLKSILNILSLKNISLKQNVFFTTEFNFDDEKEMVKETEFFKYFKIRNESTYSIVKNKSVSDLKKHSFLNEVNSFESTLWDLPALEQVKEQKDFYYSVLSNIDAVFILAPVGGIRKKDMEDVIQFYEMFDVEVYGVVIEKTKSEKSLWKVLSEF